MILASELELLRCLSALNAEDWRWIGNRSKSKILWLQHGWWQNKYYLNNPPNHGFETQVPAKGSPEVPYNREIFYPSPRSRFSLGPDLPVAYFSNDFVVNCCESIPEFSSNEALSNEELALYFEGKVNPTPAWFGYPLKYHLVDDSLILDLSQRGAPLLMRIQEKFGQEGVEILCRMFQSRLEEEKRSTQLVAIEARQRGFDGIVYPSVRAPIDVMMPDRNLVMFNRQKVRHGRPPKNRFPGAGADFSVWRAGREG
jgi:hypothetical protein